MNRLGPLLCSPMRHISIWGRMGRFRPVNQEFEEKYMAVVGPLKAKIGAWAAFSSHGTLPIELYQGTMNMVRLKAVFKKNLIRPAAAQFSGQPIRLLQDNAKYHIGHAIHQWLFNNGVDEVKIPTYSPDLNPMENMFSILKHNIEARNPKNIETLQEIAKDEWGKISQTLCRELASILMFRKRPNFLIFFSPDFFCSIFLAHFLVIRINEQTQTSQQHRQNIE